MKTQTNYPDAEKIRQMFSKIANKYDQANSVLSLGVHHLWRKELVKWSELSPDSSVLDCATGTGDLAIEFKKAGGSKSKVVGTDFCPEMLAEAEKKIRGQGINIKFEQADAMSLPYLSQSFDITSISFGIRNVANTKAALTELARVTKPGGKVMILEFGQVNLPLIRTAYNFYSEKILPKLGGWVSGQNEAYNYLQKSSRVFPCREDFAAVMNETGAFSKIEWKPLSYGIAYLYKGTVKPLS